MLFDVISEAVAVFVYRFSLLDYVICFCVSPEIRPGSSGLGSSRGERPTSTPCP